MKRRLVTFGKSAQYPSPARTSLIIAAALAFFEAVNMKLIGTMELSMLAETGVDVGLLILEMIPTLYFLVYRPLAIHIKHRKLAEVELTKSQAELEQRVLKRTAELLNLNEENQKQLTMISALYQNAQRLVTRMDVEEIQAEIVKTCVNSHGVKLAWLAKSEKDGSMSVLEHYPIEIDYPRINKTRWDDSPLGQGGTGRAIRSGVPVYSNDLVNDLTYKPWKKAGLKLGFNSGAAVPLISRNKPFGVLCLYSCERNFFTEEKVEFFKNYAHQAAAAMVNSELMAQTQWRLELSEANRKINEAISSRFDLPVVFEVILEQILHQHKGVMAVDILLVDEDTQTLNYKLGNGFNFKKIERIQYKLGHGKIGIAALEHRIVDIPNLFEVTEEPVLSEVSILENFSSYWGVPLVAKGILKGWLEIFHCGEIKSDSDWMKFLNSLATQISIAIDNALLFSELQSTNLEISEAYDTTIEGWSRALDLRDKETEGHSTRVSELSLQLGTAMGVSEEDLVSIRWGSLLHDIGKMGIADNILLKEGPLDDQEWKIMRMHPVYARDMLMPIKYLSKSIEIPYCHHEKWDGTGYPRGLKGEQIPLNARIFAVVDVWDALTNDRPYRKAWPREQAYEHIKSEVGKHFDPEVIKYFLNEKIF